MATFKATFNFRSINATALETLRQGLDSAEALAAAGDDAFEISEDEKKGRLYKRKSIEAELQQPDFVASLPTLAVQAIQDLISRFVKAQYVDAFLPIGQHDWAFIETELAKSGGRVAKFDISEETWALAADSFKAYMLQALGGNASAGQAAARLGEVMKAKFSKNSITKQINEFNEKIVEKLDARLTAWAAWAAENDTENAAEFADVFSMVHQRLEGFQKSLAEAKIDFSQVL